ncbi:MAG: SRPBCC domain-containing protein [Acidobacteria bacterium]|nr:SRPBCC domain-containing protein [Acidobacteriota bacterium]
MTKVKIFPAILLISIVPQFVRAQAAEVNTAAAPQQFTIEIEVPAPVGDVWHAFATSEGLSTWLFPNATVDLKPGGDWLVHFPGGNTGGGTIVSFVSEKELVIAALAPEKFPTVRAERTRAVFAFESRGNATVVRLTQSGWKSGDEWTKAYEYLVAGNAQLMATLHKRFVEGPVDWGKEK